MAEKEIHNAIRDHMRSKGAYVVKTAPPIDNGTPDLLVCLGGLFVGIEVKQPGKSPSKIQQHRMRQIQDAGGVAFVATSVDDVEAKFEALVQRLKKARQAREA
jgi:Holliday junction resolvase